MIPYEVIATVKGTELQGMKYRQLMPWVKPTEKWDDNAPAFVKEYAEKHPQKVFEVGTDRFVELADEAFRLQKELEEKEA